MIDYDKNDENEVWGNFEKILEVKEYINKDDEIYLDITHGFRYMPILNIFALEFLSQLNDNFKPKAILYGMFAGNSSEILDFGIFFELLEWAKAIEEMENFASLNRLVKLSKEKIENKGYNNLLSMQHAFDIANMSAIHNSINRLKNHLNFFSENENRVVKFISPKIENFIQNLSANSLSDFQFKLANFFASKNNYALAYIALAEAIVTYICEKKGYSVNSKEDRERAKDIIKDYKNYPNNSPQKKFNRIFYGQINNIRNNIAHQLETTKNPKDDIQNFNKYYQESKKYLKQLF